MSETLNYDNLIADLTQPIITETEIASGDLTRGMALGRVTRGAVTSAAGTNTGNGTIGSLGLGSGKTGGPGAYVVKCIAAATNGGTFSVVGPDGARYDDATVGTAYSAGPVAFTIADGSTDFAVGDSFTLTMAAGSGALKQLNSANTDGSSELVAIAAEDAATTKQFAAYKSGVFNRTALSFGGTDTYATHKTRAQELGIYFAPVVSK